VEEGRNQNKKPVISSGFIVKIIFEWKNIRKLTHYCKPVSLLICGKRKCKHE
jgi:hypothetical protein